MDNGKRIEQKRPQGHDSSEGQGLKGQRKWKPCRHSKEDKKWQSRVNREGKELSREGGS